MRCMSWKYWIISIAFFCSKLFDSAYAQGSDDLISVVGTGDIMMGSNYPSDATLPPNDGIYLFSNVKEILTGADLTFGNLEGCLLNSGGDRKNCSGNNCYYFRMPERYVNHLVEAGYDVVSIANNHASDFGALGREQTQKVLKEAGIHYAGFQGVCETSLFDMKGVKFGFVAFGHNTGLLSIKDIPTAQQIIATLDKECDILIVSFHGGAEGSQHTRVPKKSETYIGENRGDVHAFAHAVIDAGADIVFGHGPHIVRAAELYKDRFIIYSLGNFCTSGKVNINGINGYAPIVKVYTDREGKFVKGQIYSAIQRDKNGPMLDDNHLAAKEIKQLTELDFPDTGITLSDIGTIERKNSPTALLDSFANNFFTKTSLPTFSSTLLYPPFPNKKDKSESLACDIIEYSKKYLNYPYRRGTKGPKTFDCSGFTHFIFKHFGYSLSPGCTTQIHQGNTITKDELQSGDLIFFKGRNIKSNNAGHVGIVISNNNGHISFIHACSRGVIIEVLDKSDYYKPRFIKGLRIIG